MSALWVYAVLFAVAAGESSAFLGMVVPGEAAVLGAGALASQGKLALLPALVVVIVGASIGDSVGYAVGKRFGHGREKGPLARVWSCARMLRTRAFLERHGRKTVFLARFVGFFRALVPFAAGAVSMPYRPFLAYNLAGAVVWGSGTVLVGYWVGDAAINVAESASIYLAGALVTAGLVVHLLHRRLAHARQALSSE